MLYNTHKKYGQVATALALPIGLSLGVVDVEIVEGFGAGTAMDKLIMLVLSVMVAFKGGLFGAEFPDLDSSTSIPSKRHKILRYFFRKAGIRHRGKFSHDFIVQGLLWGAIYFGLTLVEVEGMFMMLVMNLVGVFIFFTFVGVYSHLIADAMTVDGVWFGGMFKIRFMPVFIRKFGIGKFKPFKNWFTTESEWDLVNRIVMTAIFPVVFIFSMIDLVTKVI